MPVWRRFASKTLASFGAWTISGAVALACHSSLDLGRETGGAASEPDGSSQSVVDAGTSSSDGSSSSVGDVPCDQVCAKLEGCGMFENPDDDEKCAAQCPFLAPEFRVCVGETSCQRLFECEPLLGFADGGGPPGDRGDVQRCQSRCDSAKFFSCIDAAEHANCRSLCASKPADISATYTGCATSAGTRCPDHRDCYEQFMK